MTTLFPMEGRALPIVLLPHFEQYYRAGLRRVIGGRLRAREVYEAYHAWAANTGAPSLTFSALRQQFEIVGHRRVQSNGIHYVDMAFAASVPDVADTLPDPFRGSAALGSTTTVEPDPSAELLAKVDVALAALLELRRAIEAAAGRPAPHEAAQRVLGLLDR